jgi:hypothetical protein
MTDGLALARASKAVVNGVGGAFMTASESKAAAKGGGYRGWPFYFAGRAGVLGAAPVEVVEAALPFHSPDLLRWSWESGLAVRPIDETATRYAGVCHDWGRHHFADVAGVERLAELGEQVLLAVDDAGWPLYAGWRARPLPDDDPPARAAHVLHLMREHRGAAHLCALRVARLTPLEAMVSGPGGVANATFFGWSEPDVAGVVLDDDLRARRAHAEELTDELAAPAYAGLDAAAGDELVDLLERAGAAAAR